MKAIKVLTAGLFLAANLVFAQTQKTVKFGIKAGANLHTLTGSSISSNETKIGGYGGVSANFFISEKVKLQADALYSMQGTKWETILNGFPVPTNDREIQNDINLSYLNIPVVVQYEIINGFYAEAGPQFGVLLSAKDKMKTIDTDRTIPSTPVVTSVSMTNDVKSLFQSTDFSGVVGLGYKMENGLDINARYNIGFNDVAKAPAVQAKNSVFSVGAGYYF